MGARKKCRVIQNGRNLSLPEWKEETFKKQIFIERLIWVRHCSTRLPKGNKKGRKKKKKKAVNTNSEERVGS